jgi:hypothetical protein
MILGGPENEGRREAVAAVMARGGFEGPVSAVLHAQGEGIWIVLVGVTPAVFLKAFLEAAGADAWKALRSFFAELRESLSKEEGEHGQLYVRADGVSVSEWEASRPYGPMPGLRKPGSSEPQICIDSLLPDEALEELFRLDPEEMGASSYAWDRETGRVAADRARSRRLAVAVPCL